MSNFTAFMRENVQQVEEVPFVVSQRFKDENGDPIEWILRPVSTETDESIRKSCRRRVQISGRRGQYQYETDTEAYINKTVCACVVYPNLNDKELQDSWGVMGAEDLLKKMLMSGEFADLTTKVQEVCGFDTTIDDDIDEAKN